MTILFIATFKYYLLVNAKNDKMRQMEVKEDDEAIEFNRYLKLRKSGV